MERNTRSWWGARRGRRERRGGRSAPEDGGLERGKEGRERRDRRVSWRWRVGYVVVGLASLIWLGLRSGARPSRLAYPCQRAAAANALSLLAYLASLGTTALASTRLYRAKCIVSMPFAWVRKRLAGRAPATNSIGAILAKRVLPAGVLRMRALLLTSMVLMTFLRGACRVWFPVRPTWVRASPNLPGWTSPDAISDVFAVTDVPVPTVSLDGGVIPSGVSPAAALHDDGVDALINWMAAHGTHLYKTAHQPDGIIGRDDVVAVKVNNLWNCSADRQRSHTNVDAVKGLIYRIVRHPEGFRGAVIVTDNTQATFAPFNCANDNNAQDARQSFRDVADAFAGQGYNVCTYSWSGIRDRFVAEYDAGDAESGYVLVQDGTPGVDQLSYPKFEVRCGTRTYQISMRYGLWDGAAYDNARLKMINVPIVKRHRMAGATISVKNYIGFLTTDDRLRRFGGNSAVMHGFFWGYETGSDYGLLGRQLALIRRADLNVVDAIWVNPVEEGGGAGSAVRDDVLLASTDPFAVDYYSSIYVLLPHLEPGSGEARDADARHHGGAFRGLLLTNENRARLNGMADMIDLDDSFTAEEELAQFNVFVADASIPPDLGLSLAAEPAVRVVQVGQTAVYTLSQVLHGGYTRPVTLTLLGVLPGAGVAFDPQPVIPPGASRLSITVAPSTAIGTYAMSVLGTADGVTGTVPLTLTVHPTLTLRTVPDVRNVSAGDTATYTLSVAASEGLGQAVPLALPDAPAGATCSFDPNPVLPPGDSQLSIVTAWSMVTGTYPLTVTGAAGGAVEAVRLTLIVGAPASLFEVYLPVVIESVSGK